MAIKSKIKKVFLVILLVLVSLILGAINLFSGHGNGKSQAQAQCWTAPGSSSSCGCGCECYSCGSSCGSGK